MSKHVTAVMPTSASRAAFIPWAIRWFEDQDHTDADLVIVTDTEPSLADLLPGWIGTDNSKVSYVHLAEPCGCLGAKYNRCVELAQGPYVALWADDDWHSPWHLSSRIRALTAGKRLIAGCREMLFHRLGTGRTWRYAYPGGLEDPYFLGSSVVFHVDYWRNIKKFDGLAKRSADSSFTNGITKEQYSKLAAPLRTRQAITSTIATIHSTNTGRADADPAGPGWEVWHGDLRRIMGEAYQLWQPGGEITRVLASPSARAPTSPNQSIRS